MIRNIIVAFLALNLVSCATRVSNEPYQPATNPEKIEFARARLDVFPEDVRKDAAAHAGVAVAWAGIIRSTTANEGGSDNKIVADTVLEHHYFDWIQDDTASGVKLSLSPRGEGLFRVQWSLDKAGRAATAESAESYAEAGKLAIVYGVPEKVEADGTVVLKYRYLRILDAKHFNTNVFDYGRMGGPSRSILGQHTTNAPAMK